MTPYGKNSSPGSFLNSMCTYPNILLNFSENISTIADLISSFKFPPIYWQNIICLVFLLWVNDTTILSVVRTEIQKSSLVTFGFSSFRIQSISKLRWLHSQIMTWIHPHLFISTLSLRIYHAMVCVEFMDFEICNYFIYLSLYCLYLLWDSQFQEGNNHVCFGYHYVSRTQHNVWRSLNICQISDFFLFDSTL